MARIVRLVVPRTRHLPHASRCTLPQDSPFVLFADEASGGKGALRKMESMLATRLQYLATEFGSQFPDARVLVKGAIPGVRTSLSARLAVSGASRDPAVADAQRRRLRELAVAVGMDWVSAPDDELSVCAQPSTSSLKAFTHRDPACSTAFAHSFAPQSLTRPCLAGR